jgi:hypothetical protein
MEDSADAPLLDSPQSRPARRAELRARSGALRSTWSRDHAPPRRRAAHAARCHLPLDRARAAGAPAGDPAAAATRSERQRASAPVAATHGALDGYGPTPRCSSRSRHRRGATVRCLMLRASTATTVSVDDASHRPTSSEPIVPILWKLATSPSLLLWTTTSSHAAGPGAIATRDCASWRGIARVIACASKRKSRCGRGRRALDVCKPVPHGRRRVDAAPDVAVPRSRDV